ncbi:hypothetical protein F0562_005006 [Nyssa sinensis]|uniref:AAA+ ATPase domain-containing protein n=1 Tax=Nyssa sinensis TaxID=561372 RepID=A0A5J5ALC6_9ASTE|nr:hypothetical protein F0562_005006 [Nyssa sinensis]
MKLPKPSASFCLFLLWLFISSGNTVVQACTFYVSNKCPFPIWPATAPNKGHPVIASGGFYLPSGEIRRIQAPADWNGRIWARTGCNFTSKNWNPACETGDCDGQLECKGRIGLPPVTLVQITVQADKSKPSFYDVSLVDGYNLPVSVTTKPAASKCHVGGCVKDLKSMCPHELKVLNDKGEAVACKSACLAFDLDTFCCRNEYGSPEKCKPSVYSKMFKDACPSYYSYAFDTPPPLVNCPSDECNLKHFEEEEDDERRDVDSGDGFERSKAYTSIETYLIANSSSRAKRLRADMVKDSQSLVFSMDDHEEISDEFKGIKIWWASNKNIPRTQSISFYPNEDEKRYYKLTFHRRHRDIITRTYLTHVMDEGKAIAVQKRRRKLYTNNRAEQWNGYKRTMWSHVEFEHPATFDTLAMKPKKKQEIINDLITFSKAKNYYTKIGKAWKRGYLLYGPPGTGKSTMIAAMANLLQYDVYDLELTAVKDNTELRKLLIDTSSKSIIVIEDIDCSLDLTGQRKKENGKDEEKEKDPVLKKVKNEDDSNNSKVTLSGLLNFIDGL